MNTYEYDEQISCARCHRREYTDTRSSQSDPVVHNPSTERPCIKNIQNLSFSKNIQISLLPLKISNTQYTPFLKLNIKQIPRIKENEFQIEACTKHEHVAKHLHFRYGTGRK